MLFLLSGITANVPSTLRFRKLRFQMIASKQCAGSVHLDSVVRLTGCESDNFRVDCGHQQSRHLLFPSSLTAFQDTQRSEDNSSCGHSQSSSQDPGHLVSPSVHHRRADEQIART
jgi:hypothetical protein